MSIIIVNYLGTINYPLVNVIEILLSNSRLYLINIYIIMGAIIFYHKIHSANNSILNTILKLFAYIIR